MSNIKNTINYLDNNDFDFNYNIMINIMYIRDKPVLHLVNEATRFLARQWLKNVLAQHIWDQLRLY